MAERSIVVNLRARTSQYEAALRRAGTQTAAFGNRTMAFAQRHEQAFMRTGLAMMGVGTAAVAMSAAAGRAFSDFEAETTKMISLIGVSRHEMESMRDAALNLGDTGRGPQELAEAAFFVESAGLRGADAMGVLEASAKASSVGLGETATVADLATSAVNAYGSDVLDGAAATDVMVGAVREGKAEASELASAMGMVLPVASEMGVSFDEVGAATAAMTRTGTDAGTATMQLRQILASLLKPAVQSEEALTSIGLSADGVRETIREDGLHAAFEMLRESVGDNDEALGNIFPNVRALSGFLDIMGANAEENAQIFERMADTTGLADDAFDEWSGTTEASFARFSSSLEALKIQLGEGVAPILSTLAGGMTTFTDTMASLPGPVRATAGAVTFLGGTVTVLGGAVVFLLPKIAATNAALASMGGIAGATTTTLRGTAAFMMGPWGLALGGATLAVMSYAKAQSEAAAMGRRLEESLGDSAGAARETTAAWVEAELQQRGMLGALREQGLTVSDVVEALEGVPEAQDRVTEALGRGVTSWDRWRDAIIPSTTLTDRFRSGTGDLTNTLRDLDDQFDGVVEQMREAQHPALRLADALGQTAESAGNAEYGISLLTPAAGGYSLSAGGATDETEALAAELGLLPEGAEGAGEALDELTEAQQALQAAITGFSDPLAAYTDALAANEDAVRSEVDKHNAAIDDKIAKLQEAEEPNEKQIQSLEDQKLAHEDLAESVGVSVGEYLDELEAQVTAQQEWRDNLVEIAATAGPEVAAGLANLGPEAAPLVAEFVDGTMEDFERFAELSGIQADQATDNYTRNLESGFEVAAVAARQGAGATIRSIAEELGLRQSEVWVAARAAGMQLPAGVSAALTSEKRALLSSVHGYGADITRGLASGVLDPAAREALREATGSIIRDDVDWQVRKLLAISSPSALMNAHGQQVPAGLAEGIRVGAVQVADASQEMLDLLFAAGWKGDPTDRMDALYAPSYESGQQVPRGVAEGILAEIGGASAASQQLADAVIGPLTGGGAARGRGRASPLDIWRAMGLGPNDTHRGMTADEFGRSRAGPKPTPGAVLAEDYTWITEPGTYYGGRGSGGGGIIGVLQQVQEETDRTARVASAAMDVTVTAFQDSGLSASQYQRQLNTALGIADATISHHKLSIADWHGILDTSFGESGLSAQDYASAVDLAMGSAAVSIDAQGNITAMWSGEVAGAHELAGVSAEDFDRITSGAMTHVSDVVDESTRRDVDALNEREAAHRETAEAIEQTQAAAFGRMIAEQARQQGVAESLLREHLTSTFEVQEEIESERERAQAGTFSRMLEAQAEAQDTSVASLREHMQGYNREQTAAWRIAEATGEKGSGDTVAAIASEFGLGVSEVATIMRKYGIAVGDSLAPLLEGIGDDRAAQAVRRYASGQPITGLNTGGQIPGGGPDRDSVLIAGTPEEYVIRRPVVREQGVGAFDALNAGQADIVPRNQGGPVGDPGFEEDHPPGMILGAEHTGPGYSRSGFGGVAPHVAQSGHFMNRRFGPYPGGIGGRGARPGNPTSDHPRGLALDFMTMRNFALGDRTVDYLLSRAAHHMVKYIIWKQQINTGAGWRRMGDRGSPTANHFDHPHVSYLSGGRGKDFAGAPFGLDLPEVPDFPRNGIFETAPKLAEYLKSAVEDWWDMPALASGGIVNRPTVAMIGEAGPEAVVPLNQGGVVPAAGSLSELEAALDKAVDSLEWHADRIAGFERTERTAGMDEGQLRRFEREERRRETLETLKEEVALIEEAIEQERRRAENMRSYMFERMDLEDQLAAKQSEMLRNQPWGDEWLAARRDADRLAEQIHQRELDRVDELRRAQDDAHDRLVSLLEERDRIQETLGENEAQVHREMGEVLDRRYETEKRLVRERRQALEDWVEIGQRPTFEFGQRLESVIAAERQNLEDFRAWSEGVAELRERGLSEDVITGMGLDDPRSLAQVQQFLRGTDAEIEELNEVLVERSREAARAVGRERASGTTELSAELRAAADDANAEVRRLYDEFLAEQDRLTVELESLGQDQGLSLIEAISQGMRSGIPGIEEVAREARDAQRAVFEQEASAERTRELLEGPEPPAGVHYLVNGVQALRTAGGEWYPARGSSQRANLDRLYGPPQDYGASVSPSRLAGDTVLDLFRSLGGWAQFDEGGVLPAGSVTLAVNRLPEREMVSAHTPMVHAVRDGVRAESGNAERLLERIANATETAARNGDPDALARSIRTVAAGEADAAVGREFAGSRQLARSQ